MAFDSYANLKLEIADALWRSDLASRIPGWITLAEAEMNRRIHARRKYIRAAATLSSEFVDLPADFDSLIALDVTSTDPTTTLGYVDPADGLRLRSTLYTASGVPAKYSIVGDELQIIPTPDGSYTGEMTYRQKIPALSDSNTSNWVLTDHPDIYFYGTLIHSAPSLKNDDRITVWGTLHERAISSLERQDAIGNYAGRLNQRASRVFG